MKNLFLPLWLVAICSVFITSCSQEDDIIPESSKLKLENLSEYLTVEDGQWVLALSGPDARIIGGEEQYLELLETMKEINARVKELENNPKAEICFNLPTNERIVMNSGKVISRSVIDSDPLPFANTRATYGSMNANQSIQFNTPASVYRINSPTYVQSSFLWSFELRDNVWAVYWNESGVGSRSLTKQWIYSLTNPPIQNAWRFSSTGTQTDGTNISFTFTD